MKCELCGSTDTQLIDTRIRNKPDHLDMKVYACNECSVHFLNPYYDESQLELFYQGEYRTTYNNQMFYRENNIEKFFIDGLKTAQERLSYAKSIMSHSDDVLEVGCSSGYFLYTIKGNVRSVAGTEWDEKSAAYGIAKGIDIRKNPTSFNKKFDVIFLFHVLEHMHDPLKSLTELKELLKPGGRIFIEVPNTDDVLISVYKISAFRDHYYRTAHKWNFNKKSLEYLLGRLDFKVDIGYHQTYNLSNHIHWMQNGCVGDSEVLKNFFSDKLNQVYREHLVEKGVSDIIFAKCYVK